MSPKLLAWIGVSTLAFVNGPMPRLSSAAEARETNHALDTKREKTDQTNLPCVLHDDGRFEYGRILSGTISGGREHGIELTRGVDGKPVTRRMCLNLEHYFSTSLAGGYFVPRSKAPLTLSRLGKSAMRIHIEPYAVVHWVEQESCPSLCGNRRYGAHDFSLIGRDVERGETVVCRAWMAYRKLDPENLDETLRCRRRDDPKAAQGAATRVQRASRNPGSPRP